MSTPPTSRRAWRIAAVAAVVAIGMLIALWRAVRDDDTPLAPHVTATRRPVAPAPAPAVTPATPPLIATVPTAPSDEPETESGPGVPEEAADPCTTVIERPIPKGFDTVTVDNVTVAWQPGAPREPFDAPLRPALIAHLVNGILDEAAEVTGTSPRSELVVIVYPSRDEFHRLSGGPRWSGGIYDGEVKLPIESFAELDVSVRTLRHEVMHAQLHTSVGCMPIWFNEGIASLFGGEPPLHEWLAMLRDRTLLDPQLLGVRFLHEAGAVKHGRFYAQAVLMVLATLDHPDARDLRPAIAALTAVGREPRAKLALWERRFSQLDSTALLALLASRVFRMPPGPELDAVLAGTMCCYGLRSIADLGCRAASGPPPARPAEERTESWIDTSQAPAAECTLRW